MPTFIVKIDQQALEQIKKETGEIDNEEAIIKAIDAVSSGLRYYDTKVMEL